MENPTDTPMDLDPPKTELFYGQPENTIDENPPSEVPNINTSNTWKKPTTRYTFERGLRKEAAPKFVWQGIVEQSDHGMVTAHLYRWAHANLPEFDPYKSGVFPFPWKLQQIAMAINDSEKLAEWNDIIAQTLTVPTIIFTPTIFLMLMAAEKDAPPIWLPPVMLSTTVLRAYSQVLLILNNDKRLTGEMKKDIMLRCSEDLQERMNLIVNVVSQNNDLVRLANTNSVEDAMHEKWDAEFDLLARLLASHCGAYIRVIECAILRLVELDVTTEPRIRTLMLETSLPDDRESLLKPFFIDLDEDWRKHTVGYVNKLYSLRGLPEPIGVNGFIPTHVHSLSKHAMWFVLKRILD